MHNASYNTENSSLTTDQSAGVEKHSPTLARSVLFTALGVGSLAGLLEVAFAYLLPRFADNWQVAPPENLNDLIAFSVIATVTDAALVLIVGVFLLVAFFVIRHLLRVPNTSAPLRVTARAVIFAATAGYLLKGFVAMLTLATAEQPTHAQALITGVGTTLLMALSLALAAALESTRRPRCLTPLRAWCASVGLLIITTIPLYQYYRTTRPPATSFPISTSGPRPNILLITIDTLRRDYLSCYGNPWIKTPTFDSLAGDAYTFNAAISQAPSTTPSHCSLMTGVYPNEHGAENGRPMKPELITLAQSLKAHGYSTTAFTSATTTRSINTGLQKGFDNYVDSLVSWSELFGRDEFQHLVFFYLVGFFQNTQIPGQIVSDRALAWLDSPTRQPFFTWLHYFDPHEPYGAPPPFAGMYDGSINDDLPMREERQRYAEGITYADFQLGRVISALKKADLYDNTLIILTSDHGEAFGEVHAQITEIGHGHYLSDVTQRVPLLIKPAAELPTAKRLDAQVELIDLAPTILSFLNITPPVEFQGNSFASLIDENFPAYTDRYARAFNTIHIIREDAGHKQRQYLQQLAVRTNDWKYITRPRLEQFELYDLLLDPPEQFNIADLHPEPLGNLQAAIMPFWNQHTQPNLDPQHGLSPTLVRELQALGYLDDSADEALQGR